MRVVDAVVRGQDKVTLWMSVSNRLLSRERSRQRSANFFSERIQTYFKEVTLANVVEWIAPAPTSPDFQKRRPPRVARSYGVSSPGACDAPPGTQLIVRFGILASS